MNRIAATTGRRHARVSVLLEHPDGSIEYRTWSTNGSIRNLHRKAREAYRAQYPGTRVSFGNALCTWSYGAH